MPRGSEIGLNRTSDVFPTSMDMKNSKSRWWRISYRESWRIEHSLTHSSIMGAFCQWHHKTIWTSCGFFCVALQSSRSAPRFLTTFTFIGAQTTFHLLMNYENLSKTHSWDLRMKRHGKLSAVDESSICSRWGERIQSSRTKMILQLRRSRPKERMIVCLFDSPFRIFSHKFDWTLFPIIQIISKDLLAQSALMYVFTLKVFPTTNTRQWLEQIRLSMPQKRFEV